MPTNQQHTQIPANHPDRLKWNVKYEKREASFSIHPIFGVLERISFPDGPILELASGCSGMALEWASQGRKVWAADVSDIGLQMLKAEALERGCQEQLLVCHTDVADLTAWELPEKTFALVVCTRYWDIPAFQRACESVMPGGLIAWETFSLKERSYRPSFRAEWCLQEKQPASLLPDGFDILLSQDLDDGASATRRLVARRIISV